MSGAVPLFATVLGLVFLAASIAAAAAGAASYLGWKRSSARRDAFLRDLRSGAGPGPGARVRRRTLLDAAAAYYAVCRPDAPTSARLLGEARASGLLRRLARRTRSPSSRRRRESAADLSFFPGEESFAAIARAFAAEKDPVSKLHMGAALLRIGEERALRPLIGSLRGASPWYARKMAGMVSAGLGASCAELEPLVDDPDPNISYLLAVHGGAAVSAPLRAFLLRAAAGEGDVASAAAKSLAALYPAGLLADAFQFHGDGEIRRIAMRAAAALPSEENLLLMGRHFAAAERGDLERRSAEWAAYAAAAMAAKKPELLRTLADEFEGSSGAASKYWAMALAFRSEYFILELDGRKRERAERILDAVVGAGFHSEIVAFAARNKDPAVAARLAAFLKAACPAHPELRAELARYAPDCLLETLGLERDRPERGRGKAPREAGRSAVLAVLGVLVVVAFPAGLFASVLGTAPSLAGAAVSFLKLANRVFVAYSISIAAVFLALLAASARAADAQARSWRLKKRLDLFQEGLLPSVSIIAPAFKEEAGIVQSVYSLLNLEYPDHEVVVVNDGSPDGTLDVLAAEFGLSRIDFPPLGNLPTMPVRGVYRGRRFPRLTVVDKENGGKADSLNAGLNYASKEYFCGIDADSLLDSDALLKAASGCLDDDRYFAAAGGNIVPVNGCLVDRGSLREKRIPDRALARFQAMEYARAFMGGRLGWASIGGLLIISGAFGLFPAGEARAIGGYLTREGRYRRDTVGEDMELVMRLRRSLRERGVPHVAYYSGISDCWTEVPDTMRALFRQRDRWHRGLIEDVYFHRRMILNPRYGTMGLVVLPYYIAFEILGPLLEGLGYVAVALSAAVGALDPSVVAALFVANVLMGVFVSIASLSLAPFDSGYPFKERAKLVGTAIAENFGFRQFVSLWRCVGYANSVRGPGGWGKQERRGFRTPAAERNAGGGRK